jgi:hypothetical protein
MVCVMDSKGKKSETSNNLPLYHFQTPHFLPHWEKTTPSHSVPHPNSAANSQPKWCRGSRPPDQSIYAPSLHEMILQMINCFSIDLTMLSTLCIAFHDWRVSSALWLSAWEKPPLALYPLFFIPVCILRQSAYRCRFHRQVGLVTNPCPFCNPSNRGLKY